VPFTRPQNTRHALARLLVFRLDAHARRQAGGDITRCASAERQSERLMRPDACATEYRRCGTAARMQASEESALLRRYQPARQPDATPLLLGRRRGRKAAPAKVARTPLRFAPPRRREPARLARNRLRPPASFPAACCRQQAARYAAERCLSFTAGQARRWSDSARPAGAVTPGEDTTPVHSPHNANVVTASHALRPEREHGVHGAHAAASPPAPLRAPQRHADAAGVAEGIPERTEEADVPAC